MKNAFTLLAFFALPPQISALVLAALALPEYELATPFSLAQNASSPALERFFSSRSLRLHRSHIHPRSPLPSPYPVWEPSGPGGWGGFTADGELHSHPSGTPRLPPPVDKPGGFGRFQANGAMTVKMPGKKEKVVKIAAEDDELITNNPDGTPDRGRWKGMAPENVREELKRIQEAEEERWRARMERKEMWEERRRPKMLSMLRHKVMEKISGLRRPVPFRDLPGQQRPPRMLSKPRKSESSGGVVPFQGTGYRLDGKHVGKPSEPSKSHAGIARRVRWVPPTITRSPAPLRRIIPSLGITRGIKKLVPQRWKSKGKDDNNTPDTAGPSSLTGTPAERPGASHPQKDALFPGKPRKLNEDPSPPGASPSRMPPESGSGSEGPHELRPLGFHSGSEVSRFPSNLRKVGPNWRKEPSRKPNKDTSYKPDDSKSSEAGAGPSRPEAPIRFMRTRPKGPSGLRGESSWKVRSETPSMSDDTSSDVSTLTESLSSSEDDTPKFPGKSRKLNDSETNG